MSAKNEPSLALIEQHYGQLRGRVRDVANELLRSPGEWVGKSISELARASDVSEATVVRFVRALGFSGFRAFALALASSVHQTAPREENVAAAADRSLSGIVKKVFQDESRALAEAPKTIKAESLEKAINTLLNARQVCCFAPANSGLLAGVAEYRLVRLGISCLSIRDPIQMAIQTSLLGSKDVVLAFSQTGRNRDAVEALNLARRAGATTIGITCEPGSPLVEASDIALVLFELHPHSQGGLVDTRIAEITLIDALATCIAGRRKGLSKNANRVDEQIERILIRPTTRKTRSS